MNFSANNGNENRVKRPSQQHTHPVKRVALSTTDTATDYATDTTTTETSNDGTDSAGPSSSLVVHSSCSENLTASEFVCFGSICNVSVQIREEPSFLIDSDRSSYASLGLTFSGDTCWLGTSKKGRFGCLASKLSRCLKRITSRQCVDIDAVVTYATLERSCIQWRKTGRAVILDVDINIYGHPHCAKEVGQKLSRDRIFLQPTDTDLRRLTYDNPQNLKLRDLPQPTIRMSIDSEDVTQSTSVETSAAEVEDILNDFHQPDFLEEVATDARITTKLARHQKEAVDFITRREGGRSPAVLSLWELKSSNEEFSLYQHIITGAKSSKRDDAPGGILADEMGVGKTLSMLAVVVATLCSAREYASTSMRTASDTVASHATLVVVPSALLLDSWTEEIHRHLARGTLTIHRYHNAGKRIDFPSLLQFDVVLTTYATIAAEFCRGQSVFNCVDWYRIVLDEAHTIRNTTSKQFRAICSLQACHRWCLTGTPVQNGLQDLGTLVKFLRVPVLEDSPTFRKYIVNPVWKNPSGRFTNLRRLLKSLCLRRSRSLLNLRDPHTETRVLDLSSEETKAYRHYADLCRGFFDRAVSGQSIRTINQVVFEALLRLRLFCNHGPDALRVSWDRLGLPSDASEVLSYLQASEKATCLHCGSGVQSMNQEDDSSGWLTVCSHVLCGACLPTYKTDLEQNATNGSSQCPICGQSGAVDSFVLQPTRGAPPPPSCNSTKLLAVFNDIRNQDPEDKCVVFSFWKKSLDIISEMFRDNGTIHHYVHGSVATATRSKILTDFAENPGVRVLLITFGTGAVGINKLVVANRIIIVEPQWNPSVESQAIGRILRRGQNRPVTIIRYLMKGTVEMSVASQQIRKMQLAAGGFGFDSEGDISQKFNRIMKLLCPVENNGAKE